MNYADFLKSLFDVEEVDASKHRLHERSYFEKICPIDELRNIFSYDAETGILLWKARTGIDGRPNTQFVGKRAGSKHRDGGIQVKIKYEDFDGFIQAHRICWALHYGRWPKHLLDHIDRVRNNNRILNLRECNSSSNACNKYTVGKTSGYKGVYYIKNNDKYGAQIKIFKRTYWLGSFDTALEAAMAYDEKSLELHGEYACTNKMLGLL